jgi:uncharacterized protein YutE (UPF0331/DUF86 family)
MDIERIRDKLSELIVYVAELDEDLPPEEDEYVEKRLSRRACERTFQLGCENILDICNLIIAGKGLGLPKDNRDAIRKLCISKILPVKLASRLEDMVSFRNLLVHRYGKVDDLRAYHYMKEESEDLYEFARTIEKFIENEM